MRKTAADAASAAAVAAQSKTEALRVIDQLTAHETISTLLNAQAKNDGVEVKFAPSLNGVMAAEEQPGAFDQAHAMLAAFPYLNRKAVDQNWREDWRVVAAKKNEAYAVASEENPGSSFVAREAQREFFKIVSRGANVIELHANPDFIAGRNRAASSKNDDEIFRGGLRCPSCGSTRDDGFGSWECCSGAVAETDTPDAPRGLPISRNLFRYVPVSRINRTRA